RGAPPDRPAPPPGGPLTPLQSLPAAELPDDPVDVVIRRRGSTRRFAREPITFGQLSTMLDRALGPIPADCLDPAGGPLGDAYLVVNAVDGLPPGTYVYHRQERALELLRGGDF